MLPAHDASDLIELHAMVRARIELRDAGLRRLCLELLQSVVGEAHRLDHAGVLVRGGDAANDGGCKLVSKAIEREVAQCAIWDLVVVPALGHGPPAPALTSLVLVFCKPSDCQPNRPVALVDI